MVKIDEKILYAALAFFAVTMKGKRTDDSKSAEDVLQLAGLVEAFCKKHVGNLAFGEWVGDRDKENVDALIQKHLRELRENEATRLPEDRDILIRVYDRLQVRKARRVQRGFYATATEAKISDLVLRLLDEEIAATGDLI